MFACRLTFLHCLNFFFGNAAVEDRVRRSNIPDRGSGRKENEMKHEKNGVLHCAHPSCRTSITPDPRHVANLTARGSWSCGAHAA